MPEEIRTPEPTTEMSFSDTFVGILSSPGEVYQTIVSTEPKTSNWALPLILTMVVGIIFTFVVFSQPPIQDEMAEAEYKAMQKRVASGSMSQEQADQAIERNPAKPGTPMFLVFGVIGVVVVLLFSLFAYTTAYFFAGKLIFKSNTPYGKILEVNGMSYYVAAVGALLSIVIVVAMGSLYASLSPTLFITDFDPSDKSHKLMAALNLLEFWNLAVITIGLSKVWKVTFGKALGAVGGIWAVWTAVKVFVDFGFGM